jgi:hypothetical protein
MTRDEALQEASEEHGLAEWYRPCVLPLLTLERDRWPQCCGGQCEPCAVTLVTVATRVLALMRE